MPDSSRDDPPRGGGDVYAEVRGMTYRGTYSISTDGGWVEVTAPDGRTKTAQIGEWSAEEIAERLLRELYLRGSGAVDD